jgi:hypothetical protein
MTTTFQRLVPRNQCQVRKLIILGLSCVDRSEVMTRQTV